MSSAVSQGRVRVSSPGVTRVPRRRVARLGEAAAAVKLGALVPLGLGLFLPSPAVPWALGSGLVLLGAGVVLGWVSRHLAEPDWLPGSVEASEDTLWVTHGSTRVALPRAEVARAELIETPAPGRWALVFHLTTGDLVHVVLGSRDEGEHFLHHTGLGRTPAAERLRFVGPVRQLVSVALLWGVFVVAVMPFLVIGVAMTYAISDPLLAKVAFGAMMALALVAVGLVTRKVVTMAWTASLTLGAEGFQVHGPGKARFVSYGELAEVSVLPSPVGGCLRLALTDGETLSFAASGAYALEPERAAALLNMRLRAWRQRSLTDHEALARNGRSLEDWRAALEQLLGRGGVFRDGGLGREALLDRVDVPTVPAAQRLGAALALARSDETARSRVRIAAEACADTPLREAMEAALDGRLDASMVARIEAAGPTRPRG